MKRLGLRPVTPVLSFRFHRHPDTGAVGCIIGFSPTQGVVGYGETKPDALHQAAGIARDLDATLNEHPELNAVLPPGVAVGIKALSIASTALTRGHTVDDIAKVVGPHTARLAARILSIF